MNDSRAPARALGFAVALGALVLLALAVRCWGLSAHALWRDELCSLIRAEGHRSFQAPPTNVLLPYLPLRPGPDKGPLAVVSETNEFLPPLYFLVLRGWITPFGDSATALRALSVLASAATVLIGALLATVLAGRRAGLLAALLLGLAPLEYRYGQEGRPYALLGLFAMLSTLALATLLTGRGRRPLLWAVYVVSIAMGIATHYTAVLVPFAHLLWLLLAGRPRTARPPLAALLALLALLAPLIWLLGWQIHTHSSESFESLQWLSRGDAAQGAPATPGAAGTAGEAATAAAPAPEPAAESGGGKGWFASRAHLPYAVVALGGAFVNGTQMQSHLVIAGAFTLLVAGLILYGVRGGGPGALLVLLLALAGPLTLVAVDLVAGTNGTRVPRYAFVSSPFVWVAAALGLARLRGAPFAIALILVVAGQATGTWQSRFRQTLASDIESAAAALQAAGCDGRDLVVAALDVPEQIMELNQFLDCEPAEIVVASDGRLDAAVLQQPWRRVFLLVTTGRGEPQVRELTEAIGARFTPRPALELEQLVFRVFDAPATP